MNFRSMFDFGSDESEDSPPATSGLGQTPSFDRGLQPPNEPTDAAVLYGGAAAKKAVDPYISDYDRPLVEGVKNGVAKAQKSSNPDDFWELKQKVADIKQSYPHLEQHLPAGALAIHDNVIKAYDAEKQKFAATGQPETPDHRALFRNTASATGLRLLRDAATTPTDMLSGAKMNRSASPPGLPAKLNSPSLLGGEIGGRQSAYGGGNPATRPTAGDAGGRQYAIMASPKIEPTQDEQIRRAVEGLETRLSYEAVKNADVRKTYTEDIAKMAKHKLELLGEKQATADVAKDAYASRKAIRAKAQELGTATGNAIARVIETDDGFEGRLQHYTPQGKVFRDLPDEEKVSVFRKLIEGSGHNRPAVTEDMKFLGKAGRALAVVTAAQAAYDVLSADDKFDALFRAGSSMGGGWIGGALGGAAGGMLTGPAAVVAAPLGMLIGAFAGAWGGEELYNEVRDFLREKK